MNKGQRLYSQDQESGNGNGNGGADALGAKEAIDLRKENARLKEQLDRLTTDNAQLTTDYNKLKEDHDKVTGDYAKLEKKYTTASQELGGYKSERMRKEALDKLLGSEDIKGKYKVDTEKALKYLSRGEFKEESLEADAKEAFEMFSTPIEINTNLSAGGAATNNGHGRPPAVSNDPIGDLLASRK